MYTQNTKWGKWCQVLQKVVLLTQKCRRVEPGDFPRKKRELLCPLHSSFRIAERGKRFDQSVSAQHRRQGQRFHPAKLREELGETFMSPWAYGLCLSVYSDASWAKFTEKFESLPYTKTKAMRPLFANAAKCEPDSQGRILLPQKLRAYAGLDKDVVIIGVSNRAEIWNAERWAALEAEELNPENLAAVMEELGF